jgi:hypothetical protein
MTANDYAKFTTIGYRINAPELTTWNRLLELRDALRDRAVKQLNMQIDLMLDDEVVQSNIRAWLQVSTRHTLSRREVFNYIVKLHNENTWACNWRMIIEVIPGDVILIRLDVGAITCDWFKSQARFENFDELEDVHDDIVWKQHEHTEGYRLIVVDNLEEYAQLCV